MSNKQNLETWKSSDNNKQVICEKLVIEFSGQSNILEIGSGTGQHAVWLARHLPHLTWQTSDRSENLDFIRQRLTAEGGDNVIAPIELDVDGNAWPATRYDGIFSANCIHIMGWQSVVAMFAGIGRILEDDGRIILYGPFKYNGNFTTQSNAEFDQWLKSRNPQSGIRDFEEVNKLARNLGLKCLNDYPMPANNQLLVWG